jgi:P-type Ca2+ transporter type 2C
VLAVLVTQMDVFHRLLGTTELNLREFGWALVPAIALLGLWKLGNSSPGRPPRRIHPREGEEPAGQRHED